VNHTQKEQTTQNKLNLMYNIWLTMTDWLNPRTRVLLTKLTVPHLVMEPQSLQQPTSGSWP